MSTDVSPLWGCFPGWAVRRHVADCRVDPPWRSGPGAIRPIFGWLLCGDPRIAPHVVLESCVPAGTRLQVPYRIAPRHGSGWRRQAGLPAAADSVPGGTGCLSSWIATRACSTQDGFTRKGLAYLRQLVHSGAVFQGGPPGDALPLALPLLVRLSPLAASSVPSTACAPPAADNGLSRGPRTLTMPAQCSSGATVPFPSSRSTNVPPDTRASACLRQPRNPSVEGVLDNAPRPCLFLPHKDLRDAGAWDTRCLSAGSNVPAREARQISTSTQ